VTEHSLTAHHLERALWHVGRKCGILSATRSRGDAATLSGWELVEESYRRLDRLARAHRVPVILVIFPRRGPCEDDYSKQLQQLGSELGWTVIDLDEAFTADSDNLFIAGDAIHPNAAGHRRAAEEVARKLDMVQGFRQP
jgi:hypothetical protein